MSDTHPHSSDPKYAWRELTHKGLPKRPPQKRAADFLEIYGLYDEATAREQASRCILCPNPTCVDGCPLCNPIPQWMQLTAEGRFLEAAAVLGSVTNMAEICTRLCPSDRLCESACILDFVSEPVSIQALEQFLVEYAFAHEQTEAAPPPANGLKVAVVGSGPGGMACAEQLAKKGYAVTIFDDALVPGGLLVNGTPAFKLDQSLVQRRIDLLQKRGVRFQLGAKLWDELSLADLRENFDAVYLGWDSRKARALPVPGAELAGVLQAVPFLLQKNTPIPLAAPKFEVAGKRVVVLGGGDTAMDCLRAAIRYGAREATCVYRRDEADLPCSPREYQNAREEGAQFIFCAAAVAVFGNQNEQVAAVRFVRTELGQSKNGKSRPLTLRPGTEFDVPADWLILALGFEPLACPANGDLAQLKHNDSGGLVVNQNLMTNLPGVFAGGDLVRGPSNVLEVVRDARDAAAQIDTFLSAAKAPSP